jgi:dTDP-3-amino-3,4,6-trideoxy-alpha-D-glucose transaminase
MSRIRFADLSAQRTAVRAAVDAVIDEEWFVGGPRVDGFEREFGSYCSEGAICVGVGSGTDAIELALRALGVGSGDEVITAANTCVPTVAGIEAAGATPVLADVRLETATIDPEQLRRLVTPRTKAIVPVHLYGRCADMSAVNAFAEEHGIVVLEDAAQAHGATYNGKRAGTLGHAAAFSFYPTKNLGAIGDGGAVVTMDTAVAERVRMLRSYGERERYRSELHGRNSRLDSLQAAVLSSKLPMLDERNERRRALAGVLRAELGNAVDLFEEDSGHAYHLFVVRARHREELRRALAAEGIETLVHYPRAVHQHPAYASLAHPRLGVSETLAGAVLSLPLYPELSEEAVRDVAAAVRRVAP